MDILSKYTETKKELDLLAKQVFSLFDENDVYGIINSSNVKYLEICDHKQFDNLVIINMGDYGDIAPILTFESDRKIVLEFDEESLIELWIQTSKNIIEKSNELKAKKFMKDYHKNDHGLIHLVISNYEKLSNLGKNDAEIAKLAAKGMTKLLEHKFESKKVF